MENSERAAILAEEAIEVSRNLRDAASAFASLPDGTYGLSAIGNQWHLSGSSDTKGIFTRAVAISSISGSQKKVTTTVSWSDQNYPTNSVSISTYFTNWRAPLTIGLTINKAVINHGGTKVPSDFLPASLSTLAWDNSVDPPVQNTIYIPIIFSPSTMTLGPGTYNFLSSSDPNYDLTLSSDCLGSAIILADGDTKLCNITYEEHTMPIVDAPVSSTIASSSATLGATVESLGFPASISARGICYSTSAGPSLTSGATCVAATLSQTVPSAFAISATSLSVNTAYHYRGYATNSTGAAYSSDGTFTTNSAIVVPTVTTAFPVTNISRTTATSGGNVTSDGGTSVIARGIVWSTSINPTIALSTKTSNGMGVGSFSSSLTSLACNTLYHVRAYATNPVGTSYGSDITFTTSVCSSIIFVGQGTASGPSVAIPSHNVGDLLVMFAYRDNNISPPTVPAGWTTISSSMGASSNSSSLAYRIATGNDSGTGFAGSTGLIVQVYRGVSTSPIGANGVQQGASATAAYPALSLGVFDSSSWIVGFAGVAKKNTTIKNAPTGMTARADIVGGSSEASGSDTNGGVSSWNAQNVPLGKSVNWSVRTLEIKSQ